MADWSGSILLFLGSSIILIKASSLAVRYILEIAKEVKVTQFIASFVLAGFVSILPELFVGINASLDNVSDVGIGTLIGNNIVDLTLVIGIIVILGRDIPIGPNQRLPTIPFLISLALPLALMADGFLSFTDGIILIVACLGYFVWMISQNRIREKNVHAIQWRAIAPTLAKFLVMMGIIYAAAHYVVESSVALSGLLGIPEIFAGLFLISLGAALPELTFSVQAVMSLHKLVGLADVLGNVALDATFSIGVMALIRPFEVDLSIIGISALIMGFAALMLTTFLEDGKRLTRRDGIALLGLYFVFVIIQWTLHGGGAAVH
jgi:cation:H+ antiporter